MDGRPDSSPAGAPRRTLRALAWAAVATAGVATLSLARSIIVARLVSPEEYGLFGLAVFALGAATAVSSLGLGSYVLVGRFASEAEQRRFLDVAWTADVARGALLALLVVATSVPYARAVLQPRLAPVLTVGAAMLFASAWVSPGNLLLLQRFEQRRLALVRLASESLALLAITAIAWRSPTARGLALAWVVAAAITSAASYAAHPYRPRPRIDRELFRRGMGHGRHLAVVSALTFVTTQVDNLIVGRALGPAALGLYLFAYRLSSLPVEQIHSVASAVGTPAYVRLRADGPAALARHLRALLSATVLALCLGFLPAVLLRGQIVRLLGGARWLDAADLLPPLALLALLRGSAIHFGILLASLEHARADARGKIVEALTFVQSCAVLVHAAGLAGACWAGVLNYALGIALRTRALAPLLPGELGRITTAWARPLVTAAAFAGAGAAAERVAPGWLVAPLTLLAFAAAALRIEAESVARVRQLWAERRAARRPA